MDRKRHRSATEKRQNMTEKSTDYVAQAVTFLSQGARINWHSTVDLLIGIVLPIHVATGLAAIRTLHNEGKMYARLK